VGEKRQEGQQSGRKIAIRCERCEAGRQIVANDARQDKDEPEEAKLWRIAIERCAFTGSIVLSFGRIYAIVQISHAT
jgi:hypothetical protein